MRIVPITLADAKEFVRMHHRHNKPPVGWKFGVGVEDEHGVLLGVATAGRPVSRVLSENRFVLEVNRTCSTGERNVNSMLYGAIRRAATALGYSILYTYTQEGETGASLRAAGFRVDRELSPRPNWAESSAVECTVQRDMFEPSGVPRVRWVWP